MASKAEQIERLVDGLVDGGLIVRNDFDPQDRPVTLIVADARRTRDLRIFCWNITSGGHGRSPDEFRVQTTRPRNVPFRVPGGPQTLVLGYDESRDVFAAWDAEKHPDPSGSASLQVARETLERAAEIGFAARERPLGSHGVVEIVVAFRPELVTDYLEILPGLDVTDPVEGAATADAASGGERPLEEIPGDEERKRTIVEVSRAVRNAQFRSAVRRAYDKRCAFCGLNAQLPESAHISAVYRGGLDQIKNGVLACPTHHLALDRGLILIRDDYSITVNERRLREVGASEEDREILRAGLLEALRLPHEVSFRPSAENLAAHREQWEDVGQD